MLFNTDVSIICWLSAVTHVTSSKSQPAEDVFKFSTDLADNNRLNFTMIYKISSNQKHHFERRGEIKLHSVIVIMPPIANVEFNNFIFFFFPIFPKEIAH